MRRLKGSAVKYHTRVRRLCGRDPATRYAGPSGGTDLTGPISSCSLCMNVVAPTPNPVSNRCVVSTRLISKCLNRTQGRRPSARNRHGLVEPVRGYCNQAQPPLDKERDTVVRTYNIRSPRNSHLCRRPLSSLSKAELPRFQHSTEEPLDFYSHHLKCTRG